ncbi:MAG: hypothetical protein REI64_13045 [Pedobacter sp.]|uniref:hypothetical protein n=1 Tax=Pedobacter sp. TaxID=1411316 RepID=UPI00280744D0|nr:hypothetical protein [Pedobacter sp.]MDQ8005724.1 hypothetical protein [Pedobacter sp.]
MKRTALILIAIIALASCGKNSSPDGRAQLRDAELSQRIEKLEQKQIVILDSLQLLNEKVKAMQQ